MENKTDVKLQMTELWYTQVALTREVIFASAFNSANKKSSVSALYNNQKVLGSDFAQYTDKRTGIKYESLLTDHITIIIKIIVASFNHKSAARFIADLNFNASLIAEFLHTTIHSINEKKIKDLFYGYIDCTLNEINRIVGKNYSDSVTEYNNCLTQGANISEYMAKKIGNH